VSTTRQAQAQTIEQQLARARAAIQERGWALAEEQIYRDDGYSGAKLHRPGLDRLRDRAALADFDLLLVTAPDRLARKYVHQVLLIEELQQHGCQVEFLERPMSQDPHDQLLLQIRGAVAEYERTLIAERMRRGRLAKLRAGQLLPWALPPYGFRTDPEHPRDPVGVRHDPYEATIVRQIFGDYLVAGASLYSVVQRLQAGGAPTPSGKGCWRGGTVRHILRNPVYVGLACGNRFQVVPARTRQSAMRPVGSGQSHVTRPEAEWITIPVPALVTQEDFDAVQAKLGQNQQRARRNNRSYQYLLRGLLNCGRCRLSCTGFTRDTKYHYYACRGHVDPLRAAREQRCTARYLPALRLDALIWEDLCAMLTQPEQLAVALARAQGGHWLPQELHAQQRAVQQAAGQLDRQQQRLLDAYVAGIVELAEFERKRREVAQRQASVLATATPAGGGDGATARGERAGRGHGGVLRPGTDGAERRDLRPAPGPGRIADRSRHCD
jgi:site-specific DNA recombinase